VRLLVLTTVLPKGIIPHLAYGFEGDKPLGTRNLLRTDTTNLPPKKNFF
jgi:hypothetical protein